MDDALLILRSMTLVSANGIAYHRSVQNQPSLIAIELGASPLGGQRGTAEFLPVSTKAAAQCTTYGWPSAKAKPIPIVCI